MYDTLTDDELSRLATKLSHAGHAFFDQARAIASTAFYLAAHGKITPLDEAWNGFFTLRAPVLDVMDEMHALMNDVDDTARARRAAVTADA